VRSMSYLRYVKVVGTMHVSPQSRENVMKAILNEKPNAIAVELDNRRFISLQMPKKELKLGDALKFGRRGIVQYILTKVEEKLGEEFGMMPGGEMKAAIELAQTFRIPLFLIDEDINLITMKILKAPFREKFFLFLESLTVFLPILPSREVRESDILREFKDMMIQFKRRYPYLFHILVEERNEIMAKNLKAIVDELKRRGVKKPRVLAVVGLGHVKGIERVLNSYGD